MYTHNYPCSRRTETTQIVSLLGVFHLIFSDRVSHWTPGHQSYSGRPDLKEQANKPSCFLAVGNKLIWQIDTGMMWWRKANGTERKLKSCNRRASLLLLRKWARKLSHLSLVSHYWNSQGMAGEQWVISLDPHRTKCMKSGSVLSVGVCKLRQWPLCGWNYASDFCMQALQRGKSM